MLLEENKAIVRRFNDGFNRKDLAVIDDLFAPNLVDRGLQLKHNITEIHKGFPDIHRPIEDIIAEGDKVWMYVKGTGTHTGEYLGITPTGKKFTFSGVTIFRVVDSKIVDIESDVWDFMDLYKQIGIIEYTKKGKELFP